MCDVCVFRSATWHLALTLHHFDFLPQWHPKPLGWRVSQEFPGVFVAWHIWYTVLRLGLIFLNEETGVNDMAQTPCHPSQPIPHLLPTPASEQSVAWPSHGPEIPRPSPVTLSRTRKTKET